MKLEFSKYASQNIDYRYLHYAHSLNETFFKYYLISYIEHQHGKNDLELIYGKYITSGIEGLESFAEFLREQGYTTAKAYYLKPNSIHLQNITNSTIETKVINDVFSLSFGIELTDNDPKLVEFKLKHM